MPSSSYPQIDWAPVRVVGFDMDGTLYEEADYVGQAYAAVAPVLARATGADPARIGAELLQRWREVGSGYPRMFAEVLERYGAAVDEADAVVEECLRAFRLERPELRLAPEIAALLDGFAERYPLFLVTDGRGEVQRGKIAALGLDRWFAEGDIVISGELETGVRKPDPAMAARAAALRESGARGAEVAYFGDRDVDEGFARNCGFQFLRVRLMRPLQRTGSPTPAT